MRNCAGWGIVNALGRGLPASVSGAAEMPIRELHFTAFIAPAGYHESAWRVVPEEPRSALALPYYAQLARIAEAGALDALFCGQHLDRRIPGRAPAAGALRPARA